MHNEAGQKAGRPAGVRGRPARAATPGGLSAAARSFLSVFMD